MRIKETFTDKELLKLFSAEKRKIHDLYIIQKEKGAISMNELFRGLDVLDAVEELLSKVNNGEIYQEVIFNWGVK